MSFASKSRFDIEYPINKIFSPLDNIVQGNFSLKLDEKVKIYSMTLGLKGDVREREIAPFYQINSRVDILFNESRTIVDEVSEFPKNSQFNAHFNIKFPTDKITLPSSCNISGSKALSGLKSNITVQYELYVRVFMHATYNKTYYDFVVPLVFQADDCCLIRFGSPEPSLPPLIKPVGQTLVFTANRFFLIKGQNRFKSLFESIKPTRSSIKEISLNINMPSTISINPSDSIGNIPITFKCNTPLEVDDLKSGGLSTGLGFFEVNAVKVLAIQNVTLFGESFSETVLLLHEINFKSPVPFDIKDFVYDPSTKERKWETTLAKLTYQKKPIIELLTTPLMGNTTSDNFTTRTKLKVTLTISQGNSDLNKLFILTGDLSLKFSQPYSSFRTCYNEETPTFYIKNYPKKFNTGKGLNVEETDYLLPYRIEGTVSTGTFYNQKDESSLNYDYYQPNCYDLCDASDITPETRVIIGRDQADVDAGDVIEVAQDRIGAIIS